MSDRDVIAVSSKAGWRCSSRALSAPAYPAAPNTATLGVTDPPLQLLGQRRGDLAPPGGDLLIGQGAVGGPEVQPQRQRHAAGSDPLGVAIDVKHLCPGQQCPAGPT